jgi:DNA-directed RNA polymerase subunit M/transcription elongation factor TFIIS
MSRKSNVPCPNCGKLLLQPDHENDNHDWDCHSCGLEVPATTQIKGTDVIEAYRSVELREAIQKLLPEITFIDLLRRELRTTQPTPPQQKAEPVSQQPKKVLLTPIVVFEARTEDGMQVLGTFRYDSDWYGMSCLKSDDDRYTGTQIIVQGDFRPAAEPIVAELVDARPRTLRELIEDRPTPTN